jgi:hypothetical protein
MSDEHADFLDGLHVVENELERVIGELDEMQDRRGIPALDRVSLNTLQWALNKLADDLHDAIAEIRKARLEVVSARRGEEDARELRDAASQLHLFECRKHSAEVERRLALEKQVAGLTARAKKPWLEWQVPAHVDKLYKRIPGDGIMVHNLIGGDRDLQKLYELGFRFLPITPEAELTEKLGELPPEPAPEPYQWQVGDEVKRDDGTGGVRRPVTERDKKGWVVIRGNGGLPQFEWERRGWKLYRKGSDLPDLPSPTPQQVAEFPAVAEPIDDSVGANGEGQS